MSDIYGKNGAPTDGITKGLQNSKNPGADNPYQTLKDLTVEGLDGVILIAPNGTKHRVIVANNGTLSTESA